MKRSRAILQNWSKNFRKSPLVNQDTGQFDRSIALQLFNGRSRDTYPEKDPHGFDHFYRTLSLVSEDEANETLLKYLHFCGITLRKEALHSYTCSTNSANQIHFKKAHYLLKSLGYASKLNVDNPFAEMYGDIDFFIRIETGQSQLSIFEEPLPQFYGRDSSLPEGYNNDPLIKDFFDQIENSNDSFLVTGKAGTGKSTFIRYFNQKSKKTIIRMAFTGIAAINVGGVTIHSFFQFPLRPLLPNDEGITIFHENSLRRDSIASLDTVIIDEISMLRADILEAIDYSLRNNGGEPHKPFGGKQLIFVGDPFQLPPVVNDGGEVESYLFKEFFNGAYFFNSNAYRALNVRPLILQKSYRQKNDFRFVEMLDRIRTCNVTDKMLAELNQRVLENYIQRHDEFCITLTTSNAIAREENQKRLAQLTTRKFVFAADAAGDFSQDQMPAAEFLELKRGAQVIFIRNDPNGRWVNGTIGIVDFIEQERLDIRVSSGEVHTLERETWDNRGYKFDREKKTIVSEVKGRLMQYPVKLAWAITIHKSQGLTFEKVIIDMGAGAFVAGQLYTALSRCKKLEGIILRRPVSERDVIRDHKLIEFHHSIHNPS
ncbi:MAG TPA: DEAD/DEAH box helicase [Chryseolinea sp.]|nr:DEAD/DEAH box helicase [Chryseolinea sp.]